MKYKSNYELVKGHDTDSGYDVRSTDDYIISTHETAVIGTGVYLELPDNYEVQVRPKSSISASGLLVHFGTVDSDYRGEIKVTVTNLNYSNYLIEKGQKIAQLVFVKKDDVTLEQVTEINKDTVRGEGGFGSTGRF